MKSPDAARIAAEYEKVRTRQSYREAAGIEGVRRIDLRRFLDDAGDFQELCRVTPEGELTGVPGFRVAQVNYSSMDKGAIKAFHLHERQEDVWFVPPQGKVLVGLLDCREGSPTKGATMRFVLGAGKSQLLVIPRGVAHGAANLADNASVIVYLVNQHFAADATSDEHRLPWDLLGADFWKQTPG